MRVDNVAGPVAHWARVSGRHDAIVHKGGRLTYEQLEQALGSAAAALHELAVAPGDRIAIFIENRPEALIAALAAAALGAIFVPINHTLRDWQVLRILSHSGAGCLVSSAARLKSLAPALRQAATGVKVVTVDHVRAGLGLDAVRLADERAPTVSRAGDVGTTITTIDDDPAAILYTSGSTGPPKGVLLTHRNLLQGAFGVASYLEITGSDRLLCALPLSFDAGLNQAMSALVSGGAAILHNYMRGADLVRHCAETGATGLTGVPPLWIDLSNATWPQAAKARLRYFANTGEECPRRRSDV